MGDMADSNDRLKRDKQEVPVIKRYTEQGRHGETYIAERLPVGQRRDFQPRIRRREQGKQDS